MRLTPQRKEILSIINKASQPLSAEMIFDHLPKDSINLSTVYRSLDLFFEKGVISKSFMNHTTYYYSNHKDHHHYMICTNCQKMYEIDCHIHQITDDLAKQHQFKITHHDMTIYGYCASCQKKLNL